jgi:glycosyltransferase involved in cell wall biosynthesis
MSDGRHIQLSIVIPAYNEKGNLPSTTREIIERLCRQSWSFEIIVIDDGSTDGTAEVVAALAREDCRIRSFVNDTNMGMARAFLRGVELAEGDWVMLIPADLAIDPAQIIDFVAVADKADIALGIRSDRSDCSLARRIVSLVNISLIRRLFRMPQRQFNFVAMYRRSIFSSFQVLSSSHFFHAEILIKARDAGYSITEVEARYVPRLSGTTSSGSPGAIARAVRDLLAFWWFWRRDSGERAER